MKNGNGSKYNASDNNAIKAGTEAATAQANAEAASGEANANRKRSSRSIKPLWNLRPFLARYKLKLTLGFVALVVAALAMLAMPIAVRRMIDHGFSGDNPALINSYFAMLLLVAAMLAAASGLRAYCVQWLGERAVADIRSEVFAHLTTLSASFYERTHSAELLSRLTADTTQIKSALSTAVSQALRNGVMMIGAITMMLVTSFKLSALVIVAIPMVVLPLVFYGRVVRKLSRRAQDELAQASSYAAENLAAPRTMQAFTSERVVVDRFHNASESAFIAARQRIGSRTFLTAAAIFLVFASIVGILWYGARDVLAGSMTGGALAQFVLYAAFAAGAVAELSEVWSEVQQAAGAAERLAEIMAIKPEIVSPPNPKPFPAGSKGEIAFNDVYFTYPARPDAPVFRGLSFKVKPGERVAIVGPSGAGKSTIFSLILRFYDPQSGTVSVDGVPVNAADLTALRSRMAYVQQDPAIFAGSIADNIRYGSPHASDEDVRRVAQAALASEFIEAMPLGYDTPLGERGVTLSGGQKQRVAIARALLRDAPILLLDEATSALDAESENLVQTALDHVMQGRTTLVIAHRLATVLSADRILVVDGGEIIEEGTHAGLMEARGVYSRLADLQFSADAGTA